MIVWASVVTLTLCALFFIGAAVSLFKDGIGDGSALTFVMACCCLVCAFGLVALRGEA